MSTVGFKRLIHILVESTAVLSWKLEFYCWTSSCMLLEYLSFVKI